MAAVSMIDKIDAFQQRHAVLGFPIAVIYKYGDDQGGYLAALIAYYGLLSLFPLLLLLSTVLGIVLANDPGLQQQVLDSTLSQFPVIGEDLASPKEIGGGTIGLVVGILGSLYGGLGVAQALQNAMNVAWAVPRNQRPNPIKGRGISVLLLGTAGLAILATTVLTAVANGAGGLLGDLGGGFHLGVIVATVALNACVFALAFRLATARDVRWRDVAPGAITGAVLWQIIQEFGASYIQHITDSSSTTNGVFGLFLGLIAFLYLASVVVVLCGEINVVAAATLYPRALLTPFTDDVDLTDGDRSAYTGQAEAQRAKGFQEVDVTFGPRPGSEGS